MREDLVFIAGRRTGKTTKVVDWFLEDPANRMIITMSEREAQRVRRVIRDSAMAMVHFDPLLGESPATYVPRNLDKAVTAKIYRLRGERKTFVVDELQEWPWGERHILVRDPNCVGYTIDPEKFIRRLEQDILVNPERIRDLL